MKKVLLISIYIFIILFIFSGCGNNVSSETGAYDELYSQMDPIGPEYDVEQEESFGAYDLPEIDIPEINDINSFYKEFEYDYDQLMNNIELPDEFNNLDDLQKQNLVNKAEDLFKDLITAFSQAGLDVKINQSTSEIALDSTVLFGGDSAELTDEGKAFLDDFIKAYTSIIFNEEYDGFISKTIIEGHIAPVAGTTYEGGMPLSEKRAENVKNYCLSAETGVDTTKLATTLETVGYSQSKPVYDSDGNVDIPASRRVSFKFIINLS